MEIRWLMSCALLALVGRAGLVVYLSGLSRSKNATSAAVRSIFDFGLMMVALLLVGLPIATQMQTPFVGFNPRCVCLADVGTTVQFLVWPVVLILVLGGSVTGATLERSRFWPMTLVSLLLAGVVLPVFYNWAVFGWINSRLDFIASERFPLCAIAVAVAAIIAAKKVDGRTGKYHRDGSTSMIPAHSVPLSMAGSLIYIVGLSAMAYWRSPEPRTIVCLLAAIAGALVTGVGYGQVRFGKPDPGLMISSAIGGATLAMVTAGDLPIWGSLAAGIVIGIVVPWLTVHLDMNLKIDDPSGLSAVNLGAGVVGLLATAVATPGPIIKRARVIGIIVMEVVIIATVSGALVWLVLEAVQRRVPLRSKEADEYDGLDLAEHEINAYPDFQQTTIKSYHMREA